MLNNMQIRKLLNGNNEYLNSKNTIGDISLLKRKDTAINGQHPYAVIITCSDSRVIPEAIFNAGIGDLFTIRCAGNVIGEHELGSIEYATEHLNCPLVVVLGHTQCGAIHSSMHCHKGNFVNALLEEIAKAIKEEKDEYKASKLNVLYGVDKIKEKLNPKAEVIGMLYHIDSGEVELIN